MSPRSSELWFRAASIVATDQAPAEPEPSAVVEIGAEGAGLD